jgi:3-methyladenine DNA glycosylase AlkC
MKDQNLLLADNPNTPPEILTLLARDENCYVRWRVANNPNTPPEILTLLARDENCYVRWHVERNPNATREVIQTVRAYEFYKEMENKK